MFLLFGSGGDGIIGPDMIAVDSRIHARAARAFARPGAVLCAILIALASAWLAPPAHATDGGPPVADWLREAGIGAGEVAIDIRPIGAGPGIDWRLGADRPLNPASTIKLVTTWAALNLLGPDYRWRTRLHLGGPIIDGVLHGDLILEGGGDPKLVVEDLTAWIGQIRAAGLREIRGDLVIDDAIFEPVDETLAPFDGDASQPYNVLPSGALMNFKVTRVVVRPSGDGAAIELDPPLAGVAIENRVRIRREPCRNGAAGLRVSESRPAPDRSAAIRIDGPYSSGCGEQGLFASVLGHVEFARAFFAAAWQAAGGSWEGGARLERGAAAGRPWFEWVSPRTLSEVVGDINHFSNNVMARQLLLQVAAGRGVRPAGVADGRRAIEAWLREQGLDFPEMVLDNGAGLSREARISATSLARLLVEVARSPLGEHFLHSLPRVGQTGTVRHRLVGEAVAGRAWIKTGSLDGVRAIAGYLEAESGRRYALVALFNGPRAGASAPVQDRLLRWLHRHG